MSPCQNLHVSGVSQRYWEHAVGVAELVVVSDADTSKIVTL